MKRRDFLLSGSALLASAATTGRAFASSHTAGGLSSRPRLAMPPVLDTMQSGKLDLTARSGTTSFLEGAVSRTIGYNQDYLGPVIRLKNGPVSANITNELSSPVTVHWHGLLVPGEHDGGPHSAIGSGGNWTADMHIDQPPTTAFYHTHAHGRTASDVYAGLAGVVHLSDGRDDERGLPNTYGVDDLTLVLQDRRFDLNGRMAYGLSMMDVMHGFVGDVMVVNGQIGAVATAPKGIVRLRLVNGSNARIYSLFLDDNRPMHLIATDGGFLDTPVALESLLLSPGERVEVLVDFSDGRQVSLKSDADPNQGPGGMMGRMRGFVDRFVDRSFTVLDFATDETLTAPINRIPEGLDGVLPSLGGTETRERFVSLDMGMGMGRGMMGGMGTFGINGRPFDMQRIDFKVDKGTTERWVVESPMLAHPFHIHGALFQVVREDGRSPRPECRGWKDTVLVTEHSELLVRFDQPATVDHPFMFHCHILEHEDRGMMGQFIVS